jgi:hypothetical protein
MRGVRWCYSWAEAANGWSWRQRNSLSVGRYRSSRCARMHKYAARRSKDGVCCYALRKRREVRCDSSDGCSRLARMAPRPGLVCRHAGPGEMGVVGGLSGLVLAERRPGAGPSGMRVRRLTFHLLWRREEARAAEELEKVVAEVTGSMRGQSGCGCWHFRLKLPKLDQPLPVANLTWLLPTMAAHINASLFILHVCTARLQEFEQSGPKRKLSVNIDPSKSG